MWQPNQRFPVKRFEGFLYLRRIKIEFTLTRSTVLDVAKVHL